MTHARAFRILKELDRVIEEMEDRAIEYWDQPGTHACEQADLLQFRLTERYTCRRVLKSWLRRHSV